MSDNKDAGIGERIMRAREDERRRIMASRPTLKFESAIGGPGQALPFFTITVTGGDPDDLQVLSLDVLDQVRRQLPHLQAAEDVDDAAGRR